jgi:hypothetical protein
VFVHPERGALWVTFGSGLWASSAAVGVAVGLIVNSIDSMILVASVCFVVFALGTYICIAAFGGLPLPDLGGRVRRAEAEKAQDEAARIKREQEQLEIIQAEKDAERRRIQLKAIEEEAARLTKYEGQEEGRKP